MSDSWKRAGAAATWLTISVLLLLAPRLRAPERVKVSSLEQTCQAGARREVKSFQFRELGRGYPTLPKRHPILAQKPAGTGRVHCTCIV